MVDQRHSLSFTRAENELKNVHLEGVRPTSICLNRCRTLTDHNLHGKPPSPKSKLIHDEVHEQFKVRMGFGLHAGWAIEGAVGSLFKVDATYLSPHVNMAARLETASRQYRVPLLLSSSLHELLSPDVQKNCRKVDVVTVKGSEVPVGVFAYDCFQDQYFLKPEQTGGKLTTTALNRLRELLNEGEKDRRGRSPSIGADGDVRFRKSLLSSLARSPSPGNAPPSPELVDRERRARTGSSGSLSEMVWKSFAPSSPAPLEEIGMLDSDIVIPMDNPYRRKLSSDLTSSGSPTKVQLDAIISERDGSDDAQSKSNTGRGSGFHRPSVSAKSYAPGHRNLPLPAAMGTAHSVKTRLLLNRVHQELLRVQKLQEIDEIGLGVMKDDMQAEKEQAVNEVLQALFPDAQNVVPPIDDVCEAFSTDIDLLQLRVHTQHCRFLSLFDEGVEHYIIGRWTQAKTCLEAANREMAYSTLRVSLSKLYHESDPARRSHTTTRASCLSPVLSKSLPSTPLISLSGYPLNSDDTLNDDDLVSFGDGPSQTLLNYMKGFNYVPPDDWQGFRPLTSK
jgi:hypothetical protein